MLKCKRYGKETLLVFQMSFQSYDKSINYMDYMDYLTGIVRSTHQSRDTMAAISQTPFSNIQIQIQIQNSFIASHQT